MSAERNSTASVATPLVALAAAGLFPAHSDAAELLAQALVTGDWAAVASWTANAAHPVIESAAQTYHQMGCALFCVSEAARSFLALLL